MATQTTNYALNKPTVNGDESQWGTLLNYNFDRIDIELGNVNARVDGSNTTNAATSQTVATINTTLAAQSQQINALQQADSATDTSVTDLTTRIGAAETTISALQASSGSGGSGASLTAGSVVTLYLADGSVTTDKLAVDSVTSTAIETAAVVADGIAANAVENRHIKEDAVDSIHIADDAVLGTHILGNQIDASHITATLSLVPNPQAADGDKVLFNDATTGLRWKRQNKVLKIAKYTDLFVNQGDTEPGDLLVIENGGTAGGSGANDYPAVISGLPTPASLDAGSVFLSNVASPSTPTHYTTLYTGSNGVVNVNTNDPTRAIFELADGSSYTVPLPQFSINSESEITGANIATNDYLALYDRSASAQKKIQLQELGVQMGWGSTVIEGGDGGGVINTLGIILGFEVDTESGSLIMKSTGGFTTQTAFIDSTGDFILVG
jgi:hypothetical protein